MVYCVLGLIILGHYSLAFHPRQAADLASEGVDAVHRALDDERDDGHGAVMKRQPLPTEYNIGMFGQQLVD
jgi:hypothetical protein